MSLQKNILHFYKNLESPSFLPEGVEILNPLGNPGVAEYLSAFYSKYYSDNSPRVMLIGINPGRFGGGITGIPFTDPINLEIECGIPNQLEKRHELSSKFIYEMIKAMGGANKFYGNFYVTAMSPLGFIKNDRNLNYYDIPELLEKWKPFIIDTLEKQAKFCKNRSVGISLGQGKNLAYLDSWNKEYKIFREVKALPHPRWIMQYRLKRKEEFIQMYLDTLNEFLQ